MSHTFELLDNVPDKYFGTEMDRLSPEHDSRWLELITPATTRIDEKLIEKLNSQLNILVGGPELHAALTIKLHDFYKYSDQSAGIGYTKPTTASVKKQTRTEFDELIGLRLTDSPLYSLHGNTSRTSALNLIANLRLIHGYVGDELPVIVEKAEKILCTANNKLVRSVASLESAGISVANVLRGNADFLGRYTSSDENFLQAARKIGLTKRSISKMASDARKRQVEIYPSMIETKMINEHHIALSGLTYIAPELIAEGMPGLNQLNDTELIEYKNRVTNELDERGELKLRDLMRILGSVISSE